MASGPVSGPVSGPIPPPPTIAQVATAPSAVLTTLPDITAFLKSVQKNVVVLLGQSITPTTLASSGTSGPQSNDYIYNIYANLNNILNTKLLPFTGSQYTPSLPVDLPILQAINSNVETLLISIPYSGSKSVEKIAASTDPISYLVNIDKNIKTIMTMVGVVGSYIDPNSLVKKQIPPISWKRFKRLEAKVKALEEDAPKPTIDDDDDDDDDEDDEDDNNNYNGGGGYRKIYKKQKTKRKARKSKRKARKSKRKTRK